MKLIKEMTFSKSSIHKFPYTHYLTNSIKLLKLLLKLKNNGSKKLNKTGKTIQLNVSTNT